MNTQFFTEQSKTGRFIIQHLLPGLNHPWRARINNPEKLVQAGEHGRLYRSGRPKSSPTPGISPITTNKAMCIGLSKR